MEIFSALLAICAGNSPVTGEFPAQRPVTRSFGAFFDQSLSTHGIDLLFSWTIRIRFILLWDYVCDSIAIDYVLNITILVRVTLVVLGYSGKLGQHPTTTKHNKTSTWWRHQMETFSALLDFRAGNSPVTGEFPHNGQWRGALIFSLICAWLNYWVNNRGW